ncbi:2-amino-4-hydroxy-6-hydroxymethyldihydropteridine diphosphokinase [uncultured Bacteroides sp.]|uniref:2-amino-4-hydroxy-6- hydroxymethyldihydropteridine diphosphokinase n=1 Tax=uncultured Bacteroides sp. TaxID=162156 RepID=UPI00259A62AD|nr:2-amino-4-hydroxy-6-hydroxymethyldihydropteridine diphosphokinase [uncultured Bacteroides sp.]
MAKVFLGLGTNLGDKRNNLLTAVNHIEEKIGRVTSLSSFYVTEPWGFESDNSFLNAALCVDTSLEPAAILHIIKEIEVEMGRTQKSVNKVYSDRPIDIDILLYDDMIMKSDELTIPHPLMTERDFVMKPLVEIAGDAVHPVFKKRLKEISH